ncbi:tripartite tricarboxylate transporter TctB family protein [Silicimonas algicola]|uniref:Tripartite tricarboxylate transporter TctB family protein n=1 Tax=Silicimonas algicola TaxID=1826607 RepID=A0A316FVG5_9RHOB|nr:tripartite tricarboxylate transporter TctB family protein [Silicimonas algicola]AZQ68305.1 tripartite tricarboxylate transporter TctB family protein [Silicimonas algicola]PWK52721.1 tripartite tricarboxylate transporter TctB family protein [Silicimonas algicola]
MNDEDDIGEGRGTMRHTGLWAGGMLIVVGIFALVVASGYTFGTPRRMGAGFFPVVLAVLLVLLGGALTVTARHELMPILLRLRPVVAILGSILTFALLIRPVGLLPTIIIAVILAALAEKGRRLWSVLALGAGVALVVAGIFVFGLNVPLPLFWW